MFKFLKDKLKSAISKFSNDIDKSAETKEEEVEVKKPIKKGKTQKKEFAKKEKRPEKKKSKKPEEKAEKKPSKKEKEIVEESPIKNKSKEDETSEEVEEKELEEEISKEVEESEDEKEEDSEEEPEDESEDDKEEVEAPVEKRGFFSKLKDKFTKKEEIEAPEKKKEKKKTAETLKKKTEKESEDDSEAEDADEEPEDEEKEEVDEDSDDSDEETDEEPEEKKGFFQRIKEVVTTKRLSEAKFEELFWDLEVVLLENNVAVEVIEKIKDDLKKDIVDVPLPRSEVEDRIAESLHESISSLFDIPQINILKNAEKKKPYIILFIGINGSGKTTSIAKIAHYLLKNKKTCVIAAADTFRAAAIQQLEEHGNKLKVKVVKHDYGADPAAVAFDAIKYAESKKIDFVLVDTAGRQHSNSNLMDEMRKIVRVSKPDLKLFVGESITGNDCIEQAKEFNSAVEIDGLILTKADVDEKGGAAVSVSYVTGKPILFMGMGQEYDDLKPFSKKEIMKNIGLEE